ncbi:glycosyltransferase [Streptomyces xanthochromogenes]|uniref:glycosyltransferase n=1 Tax=Streptomyces xanthochromogenes TaxID=67384 RepID=UPI00342BC779
MSQSYLYARPAHGQKAKSSVKISFLIHNRYAIGGVIKSTVNLATALADRHEVEVVSLLRDRQSAEFPLDPRVRAVDLVDLRATAPGGDAENPLVQSPTKIFPMKDGGRTKENSRLTEIRLAQYLDATPADVVISCHPGIAVCLGRIGGDFLKIAQIHQSSDSLSAEQRAALLEAADHLDALVSVSSQDAANLRRMFKASDVHTTSIPNCVPPLPGSPADGLGNTIVAAGRLDRGKRYDKLIRAFAPVAERHPDWRLRIYGRGAERGALHALVGELDLHDQVLLMGATRHMEAEWHKAAVAVSASASECLPMNLIEAMSAGLPVVSTDCDFGPREIITHGQDGLLTDVDDTEALTDALEALVRDPGLRRRLGAAARASAERYRPYGVATRYDTLFETLAAARMLPGTASWTVRDSGDIVFTVDTPGRHKELHLVCVGTGGRTDVTVPLTPDERTAPFRRTATIERGAKPLSEGTWSLFVGARDLPLRRRLTTGHFDNRNLMRISAPHAAEASFQVLLPFVDEAGRLSVRSWVREAHAEADRVHVEEDRFTVRGRLWGATLTEASRVRLIARDHPELSLVLPVAELPDGGFHFTVPIEAPARLRVTEHDVWDVSLVPAPDARPIRVGRFLGDYTDKKHVHGYLPTILRKTRPGPVRVRPFFTVNSELSLNVVSLGQGRSRTRRFLEAGGFR